MRFSFHTALLTILGFILLSVTTLLHQPLIEQRQTHRLSLADPQENMPPLMAFTTVALGGFRGVVADLLWLRASELQDEGRYLELVQLSDWITKLEPRFSAVWGYHAWNLAYNVSVMFHKGEDRWRWIMHGVNLLRDSGIRYNPRSAKLYTELGWLFQHKIGGWMDIRHVYYKEAWHQRMQAVMQGPRPDYAAWEEAIRQRAVSPSQPAVQQVVQQLQNLQVDPWDERLLSTTNLTPALRSMLDNEDAEAWRSLLRFRTLTETYKLKPGIMQEMERELGPLDWRLPQPHAAYWAWRCLDFAEEFDRVTALRIIYQSIADQCLQGQRVYNPDTERWIPYPRTDLITPALNAYEYVIELEDGSAPGFAAARMTFLQSVLIAAFIQQDAEQAQRCYQLLQQYGEDPFGTLSYEQALLQAAMLHYAGRTEPTPRLISHLFARHYLWLSLGKESLARGCESLAHVCWNTMQDADIELPPLDDMRFQAYTGVLENTKDPEMRARLQ